MKYLVIFLLTAVAFCCIKPSVLYGQDTCRIRNIVFEGAGIRGIAYGGVISALEKKSMLSDLERVGGTSAGAIAAMMLALGYSGAEITAIIASVQYGEFNQGGMMFVGGLHRLHQHYGWYKSNKLDEWLGQLIEAKTGDPDLTFAALHQDSLRKDLYITGTSLNEQRLIVFSHENFPHMRIRDAVRISVSIPYYYEAVLIDQQGRLLTSVRNESNFMLMVDGGVLANFPITMFDSTRYRKEAQVNKNTYCFNRETLGIRIDRAAQVQYDQQGAGIAPYEIGDLQSYTAAFYVLIVESLSRSDLQEEDWSRIISVSDQGIAPRVRRISMEDTKRLYQSGLQAVEVYLQ